MLYSRCHITDDKKAMAGQVMTTKVISCNFGLCVWSKIILPRWKDEIAVVVRAW